VLDDNQLSDPSVFVSLSNLCSLRELNLDRNRISAVPYLQQAESRHSLRQQPQHKGTEVPEELEAKRGQLEYSVLQNNGDPAGRGEQCTPLPALADVVSVGEGSVKLG
uniref:Uncharacterized protein n=1 Tax=Anser brachyrhynchus TaxID=132585 RepID=A0A8B9CNW6_9AVES